MLKIQLNKDSAAIEIDRGGQKHCKNVDFGELMAAMQQHSVHDFGLLPSNTRHLSVSGNNYTIMIEVPPGLRTLRIDNRGKEEIVEKVPLPSALFAFSLLFRDGGYWFNNAWVYALEYDRLMLSTDRLFAYPTPNIHPEDNRICWGQNDTKTKMKSLAGVEELVRTFFAAASNADLFNTEKLDKAKFPWDKVKSHDGIYDIPGYYKFLASNGFNKEWLRPLKGDCETFAALTKKLGR